MIAMRRIVENMGLNWAGQHAKLLDQEKKFSCMDIHTTGSDGKSYSMLCMPIEKLPLWLASINPNKISNPAIRAKVEVYQAESAIALHDYWTKGAAIREDVAPAAMPAIDYNRINRGVAAILESKVALAIASIPSYVSAAVEAAIAKDPRRAVSEYVSVRLVLTTDLTAICVGRRDGRD